MIKPLKPNKPIYVFLFLLLVYQGFSQNFNSKDTLPETVFGEWHTASNTGEYNGLLMHSDFIEFGYRAFMYQDIIKTNDTSYSFSAKDILGNTIKCELHVISKDTIQLKRGSLPLFKYVSQDVPINSEHTTLAEIPKSIKKKWYTTDGNNNFEFDLTNKQFSFRNKDYEIEDIVNFKSNGKDEYRFIVKNDKAYWMFYFKNWSDDYLQVGFHGKMGDLYKANKAYPDYRIDDVSGYMASIVPKEIRGNWLKADGSNLLSHSLYYNFAVLDRAKWDYNSVKKKGKNYILTLERNGEEKVMYVKPNTDSTVSFGANKKKFIKYSIKKINNTNLELKEDVAYGPENILKKGIATYSGIIRNFNKDKGEKTGKVSVDNIFTGNQDAYLIEINDDGSFSVSFPSYHLQQVYVQLPGSYNAVFIEPGKETWQLINSGDRTEGFYTGDLAQLNTDYASLNFLVFNSEFNNLARNINNFTPQDYKEQCFKIKKKQLSQLDSISKTRFLSKQAYELMVADLKYRSYMSALSYDMRKRTSYKDKANVDAAYMSFITPNILNNEKAIHTSSFGSLINRLKFLKHLRNGLSVTHPNVSGLGEILKAQLVELTADEEELVALHNKYNEENAETIKKQKDFKEKYKTVLMSIGKKLGSLYQKMTEEERKKFFNGVSLNLTVLQGFAKSKNMDIVFSDEEKEYQRASKNLLTKEEKERSKRFNNPENNKRNTAFTKKYKTHIDEFVRNELKRKGIEKIREHLGDNFSADVIVAQHILGDMTRNFIPLEDEDLIEAEELVNNTFIASVFRTENDKLKAKIAANKNATGFVLNETPKTEADKVFDAIISKYKGKVVYVDFWATWCGPCRSGMKRMKPVKEDMKDKDIAFVYITNPTSPETTYNNMIPDIKGEHYRVSKDEWNYLGSKFNITGIPHYLLIDKKGTIVKDNTSDLRTPETVKSLFEEYLNKK